MVQLLKVKCTGGCGRTIEGSSGGWNICTACLPPPMGDRWPHTSCGEAGGYCDNDCHGHPHTTMLDGSVICYKVCDNPRCDKPFLGEGDFCHDHTMPCLECDERACICGTEPQHEQEAL